MSLVPLIKEEDTTTSSNLTLDYRPLNYKEDEETSSTVNPPTFDVELPKQTTEDFDIIKINPMSSPFRISSKLPQKIITYWITSKIITRLNKHPNLGNLLRDKSENLISFKQYFEISDEEIITDSELEMSEIHQNFKRAKVIDKGPGNEEIHSEPFIISEKIYERIYQPGQEGFSIDGDEFWIFDESDNEETVNWNWNQIANIPDLDEEDG